jgi:ketosteroid isomerase-like protein
VTAKEITDRVWDAVESGELGALDELAQPDIEFRGVGAATHGLGELRGPQGDIPATGRPVLWESADYLRVRDGKIASWHVYTDTMAMLVQLGLAPDPAAQPA